MLNHFSANPGLVGSYLNGFEAQAHSGTMIVPFLQNVGGDSSQVVLTREPLSPDNIDSFSKGHQTLDSWLRMNGVGKGFGSSRTIDGWLAYKDPEEFGFSFLLNSDNSPLGRKITVESLPEYTSVSLANFRRSRSVGMKMELRRKRPSTTYSFELENLAVQGLKEYLGLTSKHRLELTAHVLLKSIATVPDEDYPEKFSEGLWMLFARALHKLFDGEDVVRKRGFNDSMTVPLIKGQGGDTCTVHYGLEFFEEDPIEKIYADVTVGRFPDSLKTLSDWILSEESGPDDGDDDSYYRRLDEYFELMKRIYAEPGPSAPRKKWPT
ncbi:MAG TPA: hypothetical protein VFX30_01595 [bacterium]|nr:hypothetical protein [bacterium]